jgi:hypothetical protein
VGCDREHGLVQEVGQGRSERHDAHAAVDQEVAIAASEEEDVGSDERVDVGFGQEPQARRDLPTVPSALGHRQHHLTPPAAYSDVAMH